MTSADAPGWSFATARQPARFTLARSPAEPGVDHGSPGDGTLCGLTADRIERYRSFFRPGGATACPVCARRAAAAPSRPGPQELLHDRVTAARNGPIRDELLAALRRGADVTLWVNGPARDMARFYAEPDRIVEGRATVTEALDTDGRAGLARVRADTGQQDGEPAEFVVALPDDGVPVIGRATAGGGADR